MHTQPLVFVLIYNPICQWVSLSLAAFRKGEKPPDVYQPFRGSAFALFLTKEIFRIENYTYLEPQKNLLDDWCLKMELCNTGMTFLPPFSNSFLWQMYDEKVQDRVKFALNFSTS